MIDLPCYQPADVDAIARIAVRLPAPFSFSGIDVKAHMLSSVLPSHTLGKTSVLMTLRGCSFRLALDSTLLPQAAKQHWPEIDALPPADDLRLILFDIFLQEIAAQVEQWCGQRPFWCSDHVAPLSFAFVVVRLNHPHDHLGLVECDAGGLQLIARCCSTMPVHRALLDDLPLTLDLRIARINLTFDEMQQLAEGDTILLDDSPFTETGGLIVLVYLSDRCSFRGALTSCRLTLLSAADHSMDQPDTPSDSFDNVEVTVVVDAGRIAMPLGQLRELAIGQIVDLGFDATCNVSLRVNGQLVATGELVRIAERTGVRLLDVRLTRAAQ
ncbi:FliM/FliN family flagellar motor switch protein (plasmid) [Bradyrhizobium sp. 62B]|uniref:FliM/FliN family flagellar motor switch protein n=1 Tax=Bradyrhizobium sp. 62B TaxID=2898442 RepID=UPI0025582F71|nr:FliM/FliN family flagellar motor switch protein [Bradyrhizobium sp. 62B]